MVGTAIVEFPHKDLGLTPSENKVVKKLIAAAKLVSEIYLKQENVKQNGANFYPLDATKAEILKSAQDNPEILSPYTMVERDKKEELVAIPYHVKFKPTLTKIAKQIKEAAKYSKDKDFVKRLNVLADALLDGNYLASDIYWLSLGPYKISFVIGPIERYDDKLFFKKCSYQAWVGVMNKRETESAIKFKNYIITARRMVLAPSEKVDLERIQIKVDDTLIFSGLIARYMFTSANLPNDVNLMEKYGTKVTIFLPSFLKKFETEHHPIFHAVFEQRFQENYPIEVLKLGSLRNSYLNELSHSRQRYRDAETRLREYFPIFDEISSSVFGVKSCGSLLLKDVITEKELEAIIVMFIARAFSWWITYLKDPNVSQYAQGFAIALNYFLKSGGLREVNGFSWPNFTKLMVAIDELSSTLERILAVGTYEDAKDFIDQHASFEVFERFRSRLNNIA